MKVILTNEVTGLGTAGDVVDVKDGTPATSCSRVTWPLRGPRAARSRSTRSSRPRASREVRPPEEAKQLKGRLEAASVTVPAKAGMPAGCSAREHRRHRRRGQAPPAVRARPPPDRGPGPHQVDRLLPGAGPAAPGGPGDGLFEVVAR